MKRQRRNSLENITWPTLGKQNIKAKEVYCNLFVRVFPRVCCDWQSDYIGVGLDRFSIECRNQKQNQSWLVHTHFPALGAGCMYLLRVLIGSLDCLRLLWLVRVILWCFVLRRSSEHRSNFAMINCIMLHVHVSLINSPATKKTGVYLFHSQTWKAL